MEERKAYYKQHYIKNKQNQKQYYQDNKHNFKIYNKKYQKKNKEYFAEYNLFKKKSIIDGCYEFVEMLNQY